MKLLRYGPAGQEKPGMVDADGVIRDLSGVIPDVGGPVLSRSGLAALAALAPRALPAVDAAVRLGCPVAGVGKIIGIGLNYSDHAHEAGMAVPAEPVIFFKATSAISGPGDPIVIPRASTKTDWEVELGVVIGERAQYVEPTEALDYVAGYCVVNDVSEREFQLERSGQWDKGKGCDSFAPIGPWLVTRDEIPDAQALGLWLEVNGKRFQHGNTRTMVFGVAYLLSYLSRFMTLMPGDVISTGTPPGVGMGQKPAPIYLQPGDEVRLGIDGLGEQRQVCVAWQRQ